MRAAFVLVAMVATADAEVLRMRQVDSTNLHIAGNRGAIHTRDDTTITVDLAAKGRVDVTSKGARGEHDMYVVNNATYNTDDKTTWLTTWRGTWKITKDTLALDLSLVKDTCVAVREEGSTKTPRTCAAASKRALISCTTERVDVEVGAKKQAVSAWRCAADGTSTLGESPRSWVLGKDRCIEVHGGRKTTMSFAPCRKP